MAEERVFGVNSYSANVGITVANTMRLTWDLTKSLDIFFVHDAAKTVSGRRGTVWDSQTFSQPGVVVTEKLIVSGRENSRLLCHKRRPVWESEGSNEPRDH